MVLVGKAPNRAWPDPTPAARRSRRHRLGSPQSGECWRDLFDDAAAVLACFGREGARLLGMMAWPTSAAPARLRSADLADSQVHCSHSVSRRSVSSRSRPPRCRLHTPRHHRSHRR